MFGSRRFETVDESRNNWITALFAAGEAGTTTITGYRARRATVLLVGVRHDCTHLADGGARSRVGHSTGAEADLRRGARRESQARRGACRASLGHPMPLELVEEPD
jgi:hypothetical protein